MTNALKRLPDFFLLPLLLRDIHDYTYKEIASCLDLPIGTVMSRLARARAFLRQHYLEIRERNNSELTKEVANLDKLQKEDRS